MIPLRGPVEVTGYIQPTATNAPSNKVWSLSGRKSFRGESEPVTGYEKYYNGKKGTGSYTMPLEKESGETCSVFVYGTLKRGCPNSHHMPKSAEYAGMACTIVPWPLVVDTEMGIPYLVQVPDHPNAQIVQGELYHVDEAALQFLDSFEGLHTGFYIREQLDVLPFVERDNNPEAESSQPVVRPTNTVITATAYFRSPQNGGPSWARKWTVEKLLTLPMVDRYSEEHIPQFVARTDRNGY